MSSPNDQDRSSTRISISRTHSPGLTPAVPPTRAQYGAYSAMLRGLEEREAENLARHLAENTSAPANFGLSGDETHRDKRNGTGRNYSTVWPLSDKELPKPPLDLADAITGCASAIVRRRVLILPGKSVLRDDGEAQLPPNLVQTTSDLINQILTSLAAMRPIESGPKRRRLAPLRCMGVLNAVSLMSRQDNLILETTRRLRVIYSDDLSSLDYLVIDHRLQTPTTYSSRNAYRADLYAPVIPPATREALRSHQSASEVESRAAKRQKRQKRQAEKRKGNANLGDGQPLVADDA